MAPSLRGGGSPSPPARTAAEGRRRTPRHRPPWPEESRTVVPSIEPAHAAGQAHGVMVVHVAAQGVSPEQEVKSSGAFLSFLGRGLVDCPIHMRSRLSSGSSSLSCMQHASAQLNTRQLAGYSDGPPVVRSRPRQHGNTGGLASPAPAPCLADIHDPIATGRRLQTLRLRYAPKRMDPPHSRYLWKFGRMPLRTNRRCPLRFGLSPPPAARVTSHPASRTRWALALCLSPAGFRRARGHELTIHTMPPRAAKPSSPLLVDALLFAAGAVVAIVLLLALANPFARPDAYYEGAAPPHAGSSSAATGGRTFYDDPAVAYTVDRPITGWDEKRAAWARAHPELISGATAERVLMVSGSQPAPCGAPGGDHTLLRLLKNKADYCRLHGMPLLYNTALLRASMDRYWAKIPAIRAAMVAHPEAEWVWWVDSDAVLTDMDFALPLRRYRGHNLVVHGWPRLVFEAKSWTSLNAGVFLIRNCQWSLDFMDAWAAMGPDSPDYHRWGAVLKSTFKDKVFDESDDQSALVYLLLQGGTPWREKVFLESGYYLEGYWVEIVGRLGNITERYEAMERRPGSGALRRRRAEVEHVVRAAARNEALARAGLEEAGVRGWRRPFVTHFTGCQPCSGHRNEDYSGDSCEEGMRRALNFADDQVLRAYGFRHAGPLSDDVQPLPNLVRRRAVVGDRRQHSHYHRRPPTSAARSSSKTARDGTLPRRPRTGNPNPPTTMPQPERNEEQGAAGGGRHTSSPAVYHHPPELDELESTEREEKRYLLSTDGEGATMAAEIIPGGEGRGEELSEDPLSIAAAWSTERIDALEGRGSLCYGPAYSRPKI
ncbi:hypothetical protein HU200_017564 [Digitaria exilis]|uniref:Uncharacterized protein n=1 Tax=Digitaria exilis TaxID=1010633 RepID=A0A835F6D3_9POAL|nr:hypothetical protein HU200_017564 [Digitaria exilis]